MKNPKEILVIGFAIFANFFGAGNLILPPYLGFNAGPDWWLVALGFMISAIVIPLLAVLAHARLQGTMLDFGNKVSPGFSLLFCLSIYTIAITLPIPRTASVTHEIAIQPFFGTGSLFTSSVYFALVFIFVMNRNNVLKILGQILTPLILIILVGIIGLGIFSAPDTMNPSQFQMPVIDGLLEGYQTFDALGGLLIGGVVIISLNLKGYTSFEDKKKIIAQSGLLAAGGLLFIYAGLILIGAQYNTQFDQTIIRTELLTGLSIKTLGNFGTSFLSVLVALACFTTAVSVIVGVADFIKGLFNESKTAYSIAALVACIIGVLIGQMDVRYIINVALPALMFIYPISIVLILLNVIPQQYASSTVFRAVVLTTFIFSIPDFLGFLMPSEPIQGLKEIIPLAKQNLGWVLPAILVFVLSNFGRIGKKRSMQ